MHDQDPGLRVLLQDAFQVGVEIRVQLEEILRNEIVGDVVFQPGRLSPSAIEKTLEAQSAKRLNLPVDYFVRTAAEWNKLIAANPFATEAKKDPSHLIVMAFKNVVDGGALKALQAATVLLVDDLVSDAIVAHASPTAWRPRALASRRSSVASGHGSSTASSGR